MLLKSERSKKTQQEANLNRQHSTEGKRREREAENLQATVQGRLSNMVRESPNGILDDAQWEDLHTELQQESDAATPKTFKTKNPKIVKSYGMRNGKFCQIN